MALATAYLARRSFARSLGRSLAAAGHGAASFTWMVVARTGRVVRISLEVVTEAQELRRNLVRRYPFSDV